MNFIIEIPDNTDIKPQESLSIKDKLLLMREAQVAEIGAILEVSGKRVSTYLKQIWVINFSDRKKRSIRLITLTEEWVNNILEIHEKTLRSKIQKSEETKKSISSEQKEEITGVFYKEFIEQFSMENRKISGLRLWNYLIRNYFNFFTVTTNNKHHHVYKLKSEHIEEITKIAWEYLDYIQKKRGKIKNKTL